MNIVIVIVSIILAVLLFKFYKKNFKSITVPCVSLVTGAPKTGKSTLSIYLAIREYNMRLRSVKISNFFRKLLHKPLLIEPLLYSNIPLNVKNGYVPITNDLLTGKTKFVEGSVAYIGEVSLVADSQSYRDQSLNEQLLLFNKLFGHRVGGKLFYDTQCINDTHYSIKRCLSNYIYILKMHKCFLLPFIIMYVREERYSDDNSTINNYDSDVEDSVKKILVPKSIWKCFDYRCYRNLNNYQSLHEEHNIIHTQNLVANDIVSFKKYNTLGGSNES